MKKIITFLLMLCFVSSISLQNTWAQTNIYKLKTKYSLKEAYGFDKDHGIEVITNATWTKITVDVTTEQSFKITSLSCPDVNSQKSIYRSYITPSDPNNGELKHHGVSTNYYYQSLLAPSGIFSCIPATSDSRNYYKYMALVADKIIVNPYFWTWGKDIDVDITLTLEGELKLSDIKRVKVPGKGVLSTKDFINQGYDLGHGCSISNTGVCAELNKVRTIPNLNATDVVIQAHRGIWGKPNTSQENTIGAMVAANNAGYKILESDIMPIKVQDNGNYVNVNSGIPTDLACFHDFILTRYTSETNDANRIYNRTRAQLSALSLKKPRSEALGTEKIMFFDELINYAATNNLIVCVDMKNLESKGQAGGCTELCDWQDQERKNQSLYHNLKFAINSTAESKLKNMAIKTYANYNDLKAALTTGPNAVTITKFNKVLWAPLIAGGTQWAKPNGTYDYLKIQKFLDDWFAHNESVLYYETNFFNDYDNKTSVMLNNVFSYTEANGMTKSGNVMEYIYNMTGRRAGIFSEEPVGGKGTVNRWGKWSIKNPVLDRRGDHLWLLQRPFFKHSVITTDRPDQWDTLND